MSARSRVVIAVAAAVLWPRPARAGWEAGVAGNYVASGQHRGLGATATMLRSAGHVLALGATFDVGRLSAEGTSFNGARFDHAYSSTLVAGVLEVRLPLGIVRPYADVALGYTLVERIRTENTQCAYQSGLGARAGAGVKLVVSEGVAIGLRGAARLPGGALQCGAALGPWSFDLAPLFSLGVTADYFW